MDARCVVCGFCLYRILSKKYCQILEMLYIICTNFIINLNFIFMAGLYNYEIAVRKDFADFVAAQTLPELVFVEVENMPVCARMPLELVWYANERTDETKHNFNFLFKLYQIVLQLYNHRCPRDRENKPDYFMGYLMFGRNLIPAAVAWPYCEPNFIEAANRGDKPSIWILDFRAEVAEAIKEAFSREIPENVLGYLIDEVGDLLSEYATDVNTLYSKAEKFGNGERVNSDVREYYNRRGEFKLLQHEIVVGLKQPSEKDSEDFFERYRYY